MVLLICKDASRSPISVSELLSMEAHSPRSQTKQNSAEKSTIVLPQRAKTKRRGQRLRLTGVQTLFFLLVSIGVVYILKCSIWRDGNVYYEEEWLPMAAKRTKLRVEYTEDETNEASRKRRKKEPMTLNATSGKSKRHSIVTKKVMSLYPHVIYSDGKPFKAAKGRRIHTRYDLGSLHKPRSQARPSWSLSVNTTFCKPMKLWQTQSFPTCNSMHEISLLNRNEEQARLLGTGGWRATWRVTNGANDAVALKTLKWAGQMAFDKTTEKRHRIDAVATERLTSSKYVIDIYGYCGQSVINEFAKEGSLLEYVKDHPTSREKLTMARDVAQGIADLHDFEGEGNATIVHRDIKPANIISVQGQLKLNDFNDAEFLQWNTVLQRRCGFRRKRWTPTYHSPEEVYEALLNEKVDVFALGGIIFFIMTGGHHPFKSEGISQTEKFKRVAKGIKPKLPRKVEHSKDPAIVALNEAFQKCQSFIPRTRPSARDIARFLDSAIEEIS